MKINYVDRAERYARQVGLINLTVDTVCKAVRIPRGSFSFRFRMPFGALIEELRMRGVPHATKRGVIRARLPYHHRRDQIIQAGLDQAEKHGVRAITSRMLGDALRIAPTTVHYCFGSMRKVRYAIMQEAIRRENLAVIGRGILEGDPITKTLEPVIKRVAIHAVARG